MYTGLHVKCPLFLSDFDETLINFDKISKNTQISNAIKMRPVGAESIPCGRTDRHGEANGRISQVYERD